MKKSKLSIALALTAALCLPTAAFAAPSAQGTTATDTTSNVTMTAKAGSGSIENVTVSSTQASNVEGNLKSTEKVLASFEVTGDAKDVDLTFSVGKQWAGYKVRVFVQHGDGTNQIIEGTVADDGTVAIHVDGLSIFTIAVDESTKPAAGTTTNTDNSSKSPQTGVNATAATAATSVAVIATLASGAFIVAKATKNN